jgi:hypothetical protein
MMKNAQEFDDFLINITEHENSVDECVEQLNILLADIFEQYTKTEFKFTERCEYCVYNSNRVSNTKVDKPWITWDCKNLYRQYKYSLHDFNSNRTNENSLRLNVTNQKYKRTETRLKRQYKNQQGNMISN